MSVESMSTSIGTMSAPSMGSAVGAEAGIGSTSSFATTVEQPSIPTFATETTSSLTKPTITESGQTELFDISGNQLDDLENVFAEMPEPPMDISRNEIEDLEQVLDTIKQDEIAEPVIEISPKSQGYLQKYDVRTDLSRKEILELKSDIDGVARIENIVRELDISGVDAHAFAQRQFDEVKDKRPYGVKIEEALIHADIESKTQELETSITGEQPEIVEDGVPQDLLEQVETEDVIDKKVMRKNDDGTDEEWIFEEDPVAKAARRQEGNRAVDVLAEEVKKGDKTEVTGADIEKEIQHTNKMKSEIVQDAPVIDGSEVEFRKEIAQKGNIQSENQARQTIDDVNEKHRPVRFRRVQTQPQVTEEDVKKVVYSNYQRVT